MLINASINKSKKPRGRPKKAKVVQSSFALGEQPTDKLFSSQNKMEEIKEKTLIVINKNENPNKKPLQSLLPIPQLSNILLQHKHFLLDQFSLFL